MHIERRKALGEQFREAGSNGSKAHVMYSTGKWVFFKETAKKASAIFSTKNSAINAAMKVVRSGQAESLVIHKKDGSVDKVYLA